MIFKTKFYEDQNDEVDISVGDWIVFKKNGHELYSFQTSDFKKRKDFWIKHLTEKRWITKEMLNYLATI